MGIALFGGNHQVCIFGPLRLWAERGLIHIEDARDNSYDALSVRSALHRIKAINDMLVNSKAELTRDGGLTAQEYDRQMKMVEQMVEVCQQAQVQGMPDDPTAVRDLKRRRPLTVTVPSKKGIM